MKKLIITTLSHLLIIYTCLGQRKVAVDSYKFGDASGVFALALDSAENPLIGSRSYSYREQRYKWKTHVYKDDLSFLVAESKYSYNFNVSKAPNWRMLKVTYNAVFVKTLHPSKTIIGYYKSDLRKKYDLKGIRGFAIDSMGTCYVKDRKDNVVIFYSVNKQQRLGERLKKIPQLQWFDDKTSFSGSFVTAKNASGDYYSLKNNPGSYTNLYRIETTTKPPKVYFNRALAMMNHKEYTRARQEFARTIEVDPTYPGAHYYHTILHPKFSLAMNPASGNQTYSTGNPLMDAFTAGYKKSSALQQSEFDAIRKGLEQETRLLSRYKAQANYLLAHLFYKRNIIDLAELYASRVVTDSLKKINLLPFGNLHGLIYAKAGKHQQALNLFNKLIAEYPNEEALYFYKGNILYMMQNYKEAIAAYQRVVIKETQNKTDNAAYTNYLVGIFMSNLFGNSSSRKDNITLETKKYYNLGLCYSRLHNQKEFCRYFELAYYEGLKNQTHYYLYKNCGFDPIINESFEGHNTEYGRDSYGNVQIVKQTPKISRSVSVPTQIPLSLFTD